LDKTVVFLKKTSEKNSFVTKNKWRADKDRYYFYTEQAQKM